jgi:hypothetical protein
MDLTITRGEVNDIAVSVNETSVNITQTNNINVEVVPQSQQTIVIDRGIAGPPGPPGPSGASTIGGYPVNIISAANYDALMFLDDEWTNIPQTEITDGGNF